MRRFRGQRFSRSPWRGGALAPPAPLLLSSLLLLVLLKFLEVVVEAVEALFPEAAVMLDPTRGVLQRRGLEPAWPPLRLAAALNEPGALEHLEVAGDGGEADLKGRRQLVHRRLPARQPTEDRAAG